MNLQDASDDELLLLATGPVDNLGKQRARAKAAPRPATPDGDLSDDELLRIATGGGDAPAAQPQPRGDVITPQELYALGWSPESLKSKLEADAVSAANAPAAGQETTGQEWSRRWNRFKEHPLSGGLENLRESAGSVGALLTNAANSATLGAYGKGRDMLLGAVSPATAQAADENDQAVNRAHPFLGELASTAGYLTPYGAPEAAARAAGAAVEPMARAAGPMAQGLVGRMLTGAATGGLAGGAVAGGEAATEGAPLSAVGGAAARGAVGGAALGAGAGAVSRGLDALGGYADRKISERNIADMTEGAAAGKRDRVVGRAGSKADRIDSLVRRTPELQQAQGDPVKQLPVVEGELDRVTGQRDQIYQGVKVPSSVLTQPMREMAADLRRQPGVENKAMAAHLDAQANDYEATLSDRRGVASGTHGVPQPEARPFEGTSAGQTQVIAPQTLGEVSGDPSWRPRNPRPSERAPLPLPEAGILDAAEARKIATSLGDNLFAGNPNTDVPAAKQLKRDLYARVVDNLNAHVNAAKPGVRPELEAVNAEISDWLNMKSAVEARAGRAQTPSMTGHAIVGKGVDMLLGALHPTHYVAKKAIEHMGPGLLRGATNEAAAMGAGQSLLQEANPLVRAAQEWSAQQEAQRKRQQDAAVVDAIFGADRGKPGPDEPQQQQPGR